jgi:hypothetical protein
MPFYERQPYIQPLYQLLKEVMTGEIEVPRFQREGTEETWSTAQRAELLDSVYQGFPIGTVLLWSTTKMIQTKREVGGFVIPKRSLKEARPRRLLLDGHQRLSTLVMILGPGLLSEINEERKNSGLEPIINLNSHIAHEEDWHYVILTDEKDKDSVIDESNFSSTLVLADDIINVPLNIILDRPSINKWIREREGLGDIHTRTIDGLRDRLREYPIPIAVLGTEDLDQATTSFKRINSAGTTMSWVAMVSALSYSDKFDLQEKLAALHSELLEPSGWNEAEDSDILRVCAGFVDKGHPAKIKVEELANALKDIPGLVDRAVHATANAIRLLRECEVYGPASLPYSWQLITMAIQLESEFADRELSQDQVKQVVKWFWLTTYGQVFQGVNSAVYDRSSKALINMLRGNSWQAMERDASRHVTEVERFDFRTARSKACALTMARLQDDHDGVKDTYRARLALREGASSMKVLKPGGKKSKWWHMVVAGSTDEDTDLRACKEALRRPDPLFRFTRQEELLLKRVGVVPSTGRSTDELLEARRQAILTLEKQRVSDIGLAWKDS